MPSFDGGIITERIGAGGLIPTRPDFNRRIPERVLDSGRIFRAIDGLEDLFQTKGSGASPEMLRTEMGVLYGFDLQAALAAQEARVDAVQVVLSTGAANTTAAQTFSFQTMPDGVTQAAHHRIMRAVVHVAGTVANYAGADLRAQPFGDPTQAHLNLADSADVQSVTGLRDESPWVQPWLPIWGRRETDYEFRVRSNAGGGASGVLNLLVLLVPPGVQVPV